nr:hypothetical protein Iba_chr03bCG8120 [Ipomoea batatas]
MSQKEVEAPMAGLDGALSVPIFRCPEVDRAAAGSISEAKVGLLMNMALYLLPQLDCIIPAFVLPAGMNCTKEDSEIVLRERIVLGDYRKSAHDGRMISHSANKKALQCPVLVQNPLLLKRTPHLHPAECYSLSEMASLDFKI